MTAVITSKIFDRVWWPSSDSATETIPVPITSAPGRGRSRVQEAVD